jgi:septal ring factor EnvC (AmiA/AmiB activator)
MKSISIAHQAHLQALLALSNLKERELNIHELIKEKNYSAIVNEKKHYNKIVETLKDLIRSLKKDYNALNAEEKLSEAGQTLRRIFVNLEHFDDTIMP